MNLTDTLREGYGLKGKIGLFMLMGILFYTGFATAQNADKDRAQKHFKAGLLLLETDNYKVAADEFESSVALYPTKNGYYNLATCYFALTRYNDAKTAIERLKRTFENKLDSEWKDEIAQFEEKLSDVIVPVGFSINVEKAKIELNERDVTKDAKDGNLTLDPGEHTVTISAPDFETITETIKIRSGQGRTVFNFVMVNAGATAAKKKSDEVETLEQHTTHPVHFRNENGDEGQRDRKPRIGTAIAFSIGGLAGLGAITTGVIHMSGVGGIRNECDNNDVCDPSMEKSVIKMKKVGVATNVLITVAAVGFVAGTILAFVEGGPKKEKRAAVAPVIWQDGGGLALSGKF